MIYWLLACQMPHDNIPGILKVAQETQAVWFRNFNPLLSANISRWPTNSGIYEPLLIYNPMTQEYVPWLATEYSLSENADQLDLWLQEGIMWSDGHSFSSSDVAFTLELIRNSPEVDVNGIGQLIESINVVDDNHIQVHFKQPSFVGLERIAHQPIVPEHIWESIDNPMEFTNPEPVGTGPFTEVTHFSTQMWQIEQNPFYWKELGIKGLQFPALPSNETANLALLQEEIEWAGNFVPAIDRIFVEPNPEHHHYWFPLVGASVLLYPNHTHPILSDIKVREAISRSIDRQLMVRVALFDYTQPANESGLSQTYNKWQMDDWDGRNKWTEYSPDAASKLLDDSGWLVGEDGYRYKNGDILEFKIGVVSGWSDWVRAAQVIAQSLEANGIKASVDNRDFGSWYQNLSTGEFDLSLGWSNDGPHPIGFYKSMLSELEKQPVGTSASINWHRFGMTEADHWINAFETTANEDLQLEAAKKLQQLFVEMIPAIPLFLNPSWGAFNDTFITGFPTEDNPYARLSPNHSPENLLVLTELKQR